MHDNSTMLRNILKPGGDLDADADFGLPSLAEGQYQPYSRPAAKPIYSIHFISAKGDLRTFQYVHLDSDSRYTSERLEIRFLGLEPVRITIHGRNLWRLYDILHQHRTAWVAEAPEDFAEDGQPIVLKVVYSEVLNDLEHATP